MTAILTDAERAELHAAAAHMLQGSPAEDVETLAAEFCRIITVELLGPLEDVTGALDRLASAMETMKAESPFAGATNLRRRIDRALTEVSARLYAMTDQEAGN